MANLCDFNCVVQGMESFLAQFNNKIAGGIIGSDQDDGELAVRIPRDKESKPDFWLKNDAGIWARVGVDTLEFEATSKENLPIDLIISLSEDFPALKISLGGTIEHEFTEIWHIQSGNAILMDLTTNEVGGEYTEHVKDGVQLTALPGWFTRIYTSKWIATLPNLNTNFPEDFSNPDSPTAGDSI